MQFKKGSFEVDSVIYPVAIKVLSLLCQKIHVSLSLFLFQTQINNVFLKLSYFTCSTIQDSETPFGIVADIQ